LRSAGLFLKLQQARRYALAMLKNLGSHPLGQRAPRNRATLVEPIWLEWAALFGLLVFAGWLLGIRGVWGLLLRSDPTGITLVIIVVFVCATLWCGARSRELQQQHRAVKNMTEANESEASSWAADYWRSGTADSDTRLDLLMEQTHGPHTTAWWVNGIQLKLGLLGKVIGFSILALNIGQMQNFDPAQSQELLKSLTTGLGVALLTTMVGLVGNILLGLQLTRLDRFADQLVADCQRIGLQRSQASMSGKGP
jgi:MotA/TolQ/ExbB proton channel family